MENIGLIPAAGLAKRLGSLPFSKELLPVSYTSRHGTPHLKAVATYLLDKLRHAGVNKVYTVIRKGKWDIPNYWGDGSQFGVQLAYLIMRHAFGVPYTLDQAYPFVKNAKIFLGFPDVLFSPNNAFAVADGALEKKHADIMLGLFPVNDPRQRQHCDMVQFEPHGRITKIVVKPQTSDLQCSWLLAIWKPDFTQFMHDFLRRDLKQRHINDLPTEIHIGHVIQAAIEGGFSVWGHLFADFDFIDVGHPASLARALKTHFIPDQ